MIVKVPKAVILEALRWETGLGTGTWIYPNQGTQIVDPVCTVCAVGAVLRFILRPTTSARTLFDVCEYLTSDGFIQHIEHYADATIEASIADGMYLNALSIAFEGSRRTYMSIEERRQAAITVVETRFPDDIELDLPVSREELSPKFLEVIK